MWTHTTNIKPAFHTARIFNFRHSVNARFCHCCCCCTLNIRRLVVVRLLSTRSRPLLQFPRFCVAQILLCYGFSPRLLLLSSPFLCPLLFQCRLIPFNLRALVLYVHSFRSSGCIGFNYMCDYLSSLYYEHQPHCCAFSLSNTHTHTSVIMVVDCLCSEIYTHREMSRRMCSGIICFANHSQNGARSQIVFASKHVTVWRIASHIS